MRIPVKESIDIGHLNPDLGVAIEEYAALAERLGISVKPDPAKVKREEFLQVLVEHAIEVYPFDKVVAYMDQQCLKNLHHWYWLPLRASDKPKHPYTGHRDQSYRYNDYKYSLRFGAVFGGGSDASYRKPIPYPVLLRIEEIQNAIPEVGFFVTDTERAQGEKIYRDPFLAITLLGLNELFVVERWDEPEFRI